MTQRFPYTITQNNITVFVSGQVIKLPNTHSGFAALAEHLQKPAHDAALIQQLADKRVALSRLLAGKVTLIGNTVYYDGAPVRSALSDRLITLTDAGHDASPWAFFMDKIGQNPSDNSRERLFEFIDRWETPLTPDGDFIAFKGVNNDYSSSRTGTDGLKVYNRPGDIVTLDRDKCVEDPDITCAAGLHACASHYLDSFWGTQYRVIALKINPTDVVSIPTDYNLSKMRVCRYEVLGDIDDERHRDRVEHSQIVTTDTTGRVVGNTPIPIEIISGVETINTDEVQEALTAAIADGSDVAYFDTGSDYYDDPYDDIDIESDWDSEDMSQCAECGDYIDDGDIICDDCSEGDELFVDVPVTSSEDDELLVFTHEATGRTFTAPQLIAMIAELGQRGFSRKYDIPRTTLQDWKRRAEEAGY